ncbi:unnamed protein product [Moneuplotes crassus]|uniref:Uncharacterized protein n=1 Tax=Euplotes crassus TaxID=5936 RepID=A0AAD1XTB2_EUPCR|nr:unnamed protein product [Moneuplotes crassus]
MKKSKASTRIIGRTTKYQSKTGMSSTVKKAKPSAIIKKEIEGKKESTIKARKNRIRPFATNQKSSSKLKEVSIKPSKLDSREGSPHGIITQEKLNNKRASTSNTKTRQRKPFRPPQDDPESSETDLHTEKAYIKKVAIGASVNLKTNEIQSNIDGYSQSDLWEREDSKGYLENSRKLLDRLKKNPSCEYDARNTISGGSPNIRSKKDRFKVITTKMVKESLVNSEPRRKYIPPESRAPGQVDRIQISLDNNTSDTKEDPHKLDSNASKELKRLNEVSSYASNGPIMKSIVEEEIVEITENEVDPYPQRSTAINELVRSKDTFPGGLKEKAQNSTPKKDFSTKANLPNRSPRNGGIRHVIDKNEGAIVSNEKNVISSNEKTVLKKTIDAPKIPIGSHKASINSTTQQDFFAHSNSHNIEYKQKSRPSFHSARDDDNGAIGQNGNKSPSANTEQPAFSPGRTMGGSPVVQSNEGKLIKKLGEKQKMLEKYESMLQKVNVEFQNTLNQNKDLANQISMLELRCHQAESKVQGTQETTESQRYNLQRQIDELVLEKNEIHQNSLEQLKSKNQEIDNLQKTKLELEQRLASQAEEVANSTKESVEAKAMVEELQKKIMLQSVEIQQKNDDYTTDVTNYDLASQTFKKEIEQLMKQRNDLMEENKALKEQNWKEGLVSRQVVTESEALKREILNLRNTIEISNETEKEYKNENKYLKEASLMQEKKALVYQSIITQGDQFNNNLANNLQSSLELLRTSEEINKGLVLIKLEKLLEDVGNHRFKTKSKLEQMTLQAPIQSSFDPSLIKPDMKFTANPLSFSQDALTGFKLDMSPTRISPTEMSPTRVLNTNTLMSKMSNFEMSPPTKDGRSPVRQAVPETVPVTSEHLRKSRKERIDPAQMQPAGMKSTKDNQYY